MPTHPHTAPCWLRGWEPAKAQKQMTFYKLFFEINFCACLVSSPQRMEGEQGGEIPELGVLLGMTQTEGSRQALG